MMRPKVVLLDVGGVLLLPAANRIATQLVSLGAAPTEHDDASVHYAAVAAFDRAGDIYEYREHYSRMLGVSPTHLEDAARSDAFRGPWRKVIPGAVTALRRLAAECIVVIVSDSDGTVADQLREAEVAQVGPGSGVAIAAICDSAHVGVEKPHSRIFRAALEAVGAAPHEAVMIGDSFRCDVAGAQHLGIAAIHISPQGACARTGHLHATDLSGATQFLIEAGEHAP